MINHDVLTVFTCDEGNQITSVCETSWDDVQKALEESVPLMELSQPRYNDYRMNAINSMLNALRAFADSEVEAQVKVLGNAVGHGHRINMEKALDNLKRLRKQQAQKRS